MPGQSIALVTARAARRLDGDLHPLNDALCSAGARVSIVDWDDADADWSEYDVALLRSAWDYSKRLPEFLAWAEGVSRVTRLVNPLSVVRWNIDKHYLLELVQANVPTVPSHFVELGEEGASGIQRFFALHPHLREFVVKPAIGAGARDAQRYARADVESATAHVERLLDVGRAVLLQPYLERIDEHGETALLYYGGRFSHAIRKDPLLRVGESPTHALVAPENISPRTPDDDELRVAAQSLAAVPCGALSYARVDLIRGADGSPCVLELELIEPSMFFAQADGAASRFAALILESIR